MTIKIEGREKEIRIPDEDIKRIVKGLGVSEAEAIDIWLEDEGYMENEEQEALCKKAKDVRITATIHEAKADKAKPRAPRTVAANPTKEMIIAEVATAVRNIAGATDVIIENAGKIITFRIGEDEFKLDLVQKRKKK